MKRAGFTMIELIFVIVILGILSAVALPRFIGVSEQAQAGKCQGFIGTMNRTVLPAMWSDMVLNTETVAVAFTAARLEAQIAVPAECGTNTDETPAGATARATEYMAELVAPRGFAIAIGASIFDVNGSLPSTTQSPTMDWTKQ